MWYVIEVSVVLQISYKCVIMKVCYVTEVGSPPLGSPQLPPCSVSSELTEMANDAATFEQRLLQVGDKVCVCVCVCVAFYFVCVCARAGRVLIVCFLMFICSCVT